MPILPVSRLVAIALLSALAASGARADCIADAAARHHVNADVLRAIGWQESRLQPLALHHNADGSTDVGAFQINSAHLAELARHGIDRASLADGCVCADVAAWYYRRQVDREGNTWLAAGAYHSRTAARAAWYANRIAAILMRWRVMPAGELPFPAGSAPAPGPKRQPLPPARAPDRASLEAAAAVRDVPALAPPTR